MKDKIKFHKKLIELGGSLAITLPPELREYLELKTNAQITMTAEKGKHGKYITLWKK